MNLQAFTRRAVPPIMAAAALGAGLTACGQASGPQPPASAPATPAAAVAASATPTLSAPQLQFVSDVRNVLTFGSDVADAKVASFGQHACRSVQSGTLAGEVQPARRAFPTISKGDAIQLITIAEKDLCPTQSAPDKVTYVVTGSAANVTYGPTGSDYTGTAPMSVTRPLGQPQFYSINAQLTGNGAVTCKLQVDGVTIATGSASGESNVASCEIEQGLNGSWVDTNASAGG